MATVIVDTSGTVAWGTVPTRFAIPLGATSVSLVATAPSFNKWILGWDARNAAGTTVQSYLNNENGEFGTTFAHTATLVSTAVETMAFIWQGQGVTQTGTWTCRFTFTVPDSTVTPCYYGSQIKAGMPGMVVVDQLILQSALALIPGEWLGFLLNWYLGTTVDLHVLCSGVPLEPLPIATSFLINPGHGALDVLYRVLWPYYCECQSGATYTPPPPTYTPTKPTDWPNTPVYPPNTTNPCLDISLVRAMLDQLLRLVQRDLELDKVMQRYSTPFGTIPGATHASLTGGGTIAVERIIGVLVTWTDGEPAAVWEGTPPYFKDLGWLSMSDGEAMLQEVRVTRQQQVWMPKHMQLATQIGYYAKPGIELAIQELLAEP